MRRPGAVTLANGTDCYVITQELVDDLPTKPTRLGTVKMAHGIYTLYASARQSWVIYAVEGETK